MKFITTYAVIVLLTLAACTQTDKKYKYPYKNPNLPVSERVSDLLSRMTTLEKIKQLDMYSGGEVANVVNHDTNSFSARKTADAIGQTGIGSIHDLYPENASIVNRIQKYAVNHTRLGIPVLFIEEGLHGYNGAGATTFPVPLELASTWDTSLVHSVGRVIATEARAHGVEMILGPVLGLARDPRWGRVEETYGEDPYLVAANGLAMVKGLQGDTLDNDNTVIAEPKHFAIHSIPEAGSNTSPVSVGEREARTDFLYPFQTAVEKGGAMGIMAAYSEDDGIPCVDNHWLLTDVLRKEWGFKGFVLSDLGAIKMSLQNHHVAADTSDAMAQTLKAGLDMQFYDFGHKGLVKAVRLALKDKEVSEKDLDRAAGDILRVKFILGLFDHPYVDTMLVSKVFHTSQDQKLALQAASKGIILLKNDHDLLPIKRNVHSLAVIGPLAGSTYLGDYSGDATGISILDGLKQRIGKSTRIDYAEGYGKGPVNTRKQRELIRSAVAVAKRCDMSIVVLGESKRVDGEGKDRADLNLDQRQLNLIKAVEQTGKPVAVVLFNGRPLTINWVARHVPSIIEAWYPGEKGGLAIADVLLGRVDPSGRLPITFPRSVGQLPFYYDHKPTSWHRYVDEANTPLFPFGFGLSYTTFTYSDLKINPTKISTVSPIYVSVKVKNTGKVKGTEVVELYIRDVVSSVTTPVLALKGFHRVTLNPGQSGVVHFKITSDELALWNRKMKHVVEPGEFKVMIGSSSTDIRQTGDFWVVK